MGHDPDDLSEVSGHIWSCDAAAINRLRPLLEDSEGNFEISSSSTDAGYMINGVP